MQLILQVFVHIVWGGTYIFLCFIISSSFFTDIHMFVHIHWYSAPHLIAVHTSRIRVKRVLVFLIFLTIFSLIALLFYVVPSVLISDIQSLETIERDKYSTFCYEFLSCYRSCILSLYRKSSATMAASACNKNNNYNCCLLCCNDVIKSWLQFVKAVATIFC